MRAQQLVDAELRGDHGHAGAPRLVRELVQLVDLDLAAEHLDPPLLQLPWDHLVPVRDVLRNRGDEGGIERERSPRHLRPELLSQRARELLLLHQLELEQVGAQAPAVEHLPVQRFLEPFLVQVALAHEDLSDLRHLVSRG